ncbi:MAG: iron chaperone [Ferruginibacter sp.]
MKSKTVPAKNVPEYMAGFPEDVQKKMQELRDAIKKAAPQAEETIAYMMPAYKFHGPLVYFAGFKNHIGFYATPNGNEAFKKELSVYKQGKGSVQFPLNEQVPLDLVSKIVKFRVKQNREKAKAKIKP